VWLERLLVGAGVDSGTGWKAAALAGSVVMAVALLGLVGLRETYGVDLDYEEV